MREKITHDDELKLAVRGDCPICRAPDGKPCTNAEGEEMEPGRCHAGRLRFGLRKLGSRAPSDQRG